MLWIISVVEIGGRDAICIFRNSSLDMMIKIKAQRPERSRFNTAFVRKIILIDIGITYFESLGTLILMTASDNRLLSSDMKYKLPDRPPTT